MGDLETLGAELDRKLDITADIVDVLAVYGGVDGQRQPELRHPAGNVELLLGRARIGADPLGVFRVDVLERDLDVIEAALGEVLQPPAIEGHRGGDQVGVKPSL